MTQALRSVLEQPIAGLRVGFRRARANRRRRGVASCLASDAGVAGGNAQPAAHAASGRATRRRPTVAPAAATGAIAAQRQLHDHRPPRPGEPHAHRRADPHLAQHLDHSGDEPPLPPLLQRVAEHALDLDARERARRRAPSSPSVRRRTGAGSTSPASSSSARAARRST